MIFSIIIPVYNKDVKIIFRTLISIIAQNYPKEKYEVILVDDGSDTRAYCYDKIVEFFKLKMNLKYFYNNNRKLGSPVYAWNIGIKKSKAPIIILNGADIMHLGKNLEYFEKLFYDKDNKVDDSNFLDKFMDVGNTGGISGYDNEFLYNRTEIDDTLFVATVFMVVKKRVYEYVFPYGQDKIFETLYNKELYQIINDSLKGRFFRKNKFSDYFLELTGINSKKGFPFLVAAKADLFFEMNGFNENMYRPGWDDYDWWMRVLSFVKIAMIKDIVGLHQWHDKHFVDDKDDLNKISSYYFMKDVYKNKIMRSVVNLDRNWGEIDNFIYKRTSKKIYKDSKFLGDR